jgi:DNA-binding NarL/FixJ family response regulator
VLVPAEAHALEPLAPNTAHQQTLGITARELEILTLIARDFANREIATQLFVSENTVKNTVSAPSTSSEPPSAPTPSSAAKN